MSSHPLHPAAVHWPIALLSAAYAADVLRASLSLVPAGISAYAPRASELTVLSYYALSAGLLSALPAVVSGVTEAARLLQREGAMYEPGTKRLKPKVKTLFAHAVLNDVAVLASAVCWWKRRGAGGPAAVPEAWMVGTGAVVGGVLLFAASLGGTLVYNYGSGLRIAKGKTK